VKIKKHFEKQKQEYLWVGSLVVVAGITYLIMRNANAQPIGPGTSVTAQNGISVLGNKVVMNNVSYISANRQGPPSWVVRCIETGEIYTSQNAAAEAIGLSPSELSKHLNGLMDHVRGYTFERICLAA